MKHSICSRSISAALVLTASALFSTEVIAQTTATTIPVGFITATIPAAPSLSNPSNSVVSIPLYQTAAFSSAVDGLVSATEFTMSGAVFTPGAFVTVPHFVRVKTSATSSHVGRFFLIAANTNNKLTVSLPSGVANINTVVSVADTCEIVPANTLGTVFQSVLPQLKKTDDPATADNVLIWGGTTWETYYYDPNFNGPNQGSWASASSLDPQDATVIFPDEGLFIIHRLTSPVPLVLMGTVPSTAEKSALAGGTPSAPGFTFLSNRFPVNSTFGSVALQNLPGWVKNADPAAADNALLWNGSTWDTYYYDADFNGPAQGAWASASSLDPQDSTPIPATSALFVIRKGGVLQSLAQTLPYTP